MPLFKSTQLDSVKLGGGLSTSGNLVLFVSLLAAVLCAVIARWASNAANYEEEGAGRKPPIYRSFVPYCGPLLVMIWDTPSLMSSIASVLARRTSDQVFMNNAEMLPI